MSLFLDSAQTDEVRTAMQWGWAAGVTSNPILLARSGPPPAEALARAEYKRELAQLREFTSELAALTRSERPAPVKAQTMASRASREFASGQDALIEALKDEDKYVRRAALLIAALGAPLRCPPNASNG